MSRSVAVLTMAIALFTLHSHAARPFAVDDAATVAKDGYEIEVALDYWDGSAAVGLGIKHGITDRVDIGLGFGYTALPEEEALHGPMELGLKYVLMPDFLSASLSASFYNPAYAVNLIASRSFGMASLNANLGMETKSSSNSVALTYGLAAKFTKGIVTGGVELAGVDKKINWWQAGAQVSIFEWMAVDFGIGGDFAEEMSLRATSGVWFGF